MNSNAPGETGGEQAISSLRLLRVARNHARRGGSQHLAGHAALRAMDDFGRSRPARADRLEQLRGRQPGRGIAAHEPERRLAGDHPDHLRMAQLGWHAGELADELQAYPAPC